MAGLAQASEQSFDEVFAQRLHRILRTAYRILGNWHDAEDVAQEVFVRLHRHGLKFASEAAMDGWLYRVAVNLSLDRARAARPQEALPFELGTDPSVETNLIRQQQSERLMKALARLPVKERAAIVLREIEGLSTAEVARILGSREVTVRSQISRALARLRTIFEQEQP